MRKNIFPIAIVLALFLTGCAANMVSKPFNHELMRESESSLKILEEVLEFVGHEVAKEADVIPDIDFAWAKYYAAQVSLATGRNTEAEQYLQKAIDLAEKVVLTLKEFVLGKQPKGLLKESSTSL